MQQTDPVFSSLTPEEMLAQKPRPRWDLVPARCWPRLRDIRLHCYHKAEGLSLKELLAILGIKTSETLNMVLFSPYTVRHHQIRRQLEERYGVPITTLIQCRENASASCFLDKTHPLIEEICRLRKTELFT